MPPSQFVFALQSRKGEERSTVSFVRNRICRSRHSPFRFVSGFRPSAPWGALDVGVLPIFNLWVMCLLGLLSRGRRGRPLLLGLSIGAPLSFLMYASFLLTDFGEIVFYKYLVVAQKFELFLDRNVILRFVDHPIPRKRSYPPVFWVLIQLMYAVYLAIPQFLVTLAVGVVYRSVVSFARNTSVDTGGLDRIAP